MPPAPTSPSSPPHFAAVTVLTAAIPPSAAGPRSGLTAPARDVTLTLHLPQAVSATITGLDADALTVVVLDLVSATTRPAAGQC